MKTTIKYLWIITILIIVVPLMTVCNEHHSEDSTPTPGLEYTLISGPAYAVGIGTAKDVHIVIPATHNELPVTTIRGEGFRGSAILSVTIPNSITSIGGYAFAVCLGLTSLTIPNSVTSIGESAFAGCSGLTSVSISNSITTIGSGTFLNCTRLTSITIPNGVTSIGNYSFYNCTGLTSVTIPNSVTSIGESAFNSCSGLTSITIPNSVTYIGNYSFSNCTGLTSVTFRGAAPIQIYYGSNPFDGNLKDMWSVGGIGTYTRQLGSNVWIKQ